MKKNIRKTREKKEKERVSRVAQHRYDTRSDLICDRGDGRSR